MDVQLLPTEMWEIVFGYLEPMHDWPAAATCKLFYELLRRKRVLRGDATWTTWIAGRFSTVEIMKREIRLGYRPCEYTLTLAALFGHLDVLIWLSQHARCGASSPCMRAALSPNKNNGLRARMRAVTDNCCLKLGIRVESYQSQWASQGGHMHVLEWITDHAGCLKYDALADGARLGRIDMLEFVDSLGLPEQRAQQRAIAHTAREAAKASRINALVWLQEHAYCMTSAMSGAAESGSWDTIRWVHANVGTRASSAVGGAIRGGRVDVWEWLIDNGYPRSGGDVYEIAAEAGQLPIMQYAYALGCPLPDAPRARRITMEAIRKNRLDILQWGVGVGMSWSDHDVYQYARDWRIFRWAHDTQGMELQISLWQRFTDQPIAAYDWLHAAQLHKPDDMGYVYRYAAEKKNPRVLAWLRGHHCPCGPGAIEEAIRYGPDFARTARLLREVGGCPWNESACTAACFRDDAFLLMWLRANGCPMDEEECLRQSSATTLVHNLFYYRPCGMLVHLILPWLQIIIWCCFFSILAWKSATSS